MNKKKETSEKALICNNCGNIFTFPTEDYICPYCFSDNIQINLNFKNLNLIKEKKQEKRQNSKMNKEEIKIGS